MPERLSPWLLLRRVTSWISQRLAIPVTRDHNFGNASITHSRLRINRLAFCAILFFSAIGVRLLHWQDSVIEVWHGQSMITTMGTTYEPEALNMLRDGYILFPRVFSTPSDATMVLHPPGYSILMAGIYGLFGNSDANIQLLQIVGDAAAAVMIFLIAGELLPYAVAIVAGMLVALSPHLAYYSLWISPDSLTVLPILAAAYFIILAVKKPRLITVVAAGMGLGLSCWLRSNSLLLAPLVAILILRLFERGKRLRYTVVFVGTTLIVISPITIRNLVLFHRFIPLSVGAGITLIEGIADYDKEHVFGMPFTDEEAAHMEARLYARPDYNGDLWTSDGVERDRARFARGLVAIRSHPAWFLGVMVRRAGFMLRYNDSGPHNWPFHSASVPIVSASPPVSHSPEPKDGMQPVWSSSPADLIANGTILSPRAEISVGDNGTVLQVRSDSSEYGDQFAPASARVQKNTDYVLRLLVNLEQGEMAAKITTSDRRVALASEIIADAQRKTRKRSKKNKERSSTEPGEADSTAEQDLASILIPFASGTTNEVHLVLSNNGPQADSSFLRVGRADLLELGPTAYTWTRYPRVLIRGIQKNLFTTGRMLPLEIIGIALLAIAGRWRALAILLVVPFYYLSLHSAFHTEYRYILAIHYFLFVMAATALFCFGTALWQGLGWAVRVSRKRASAPFIA
jgi:hypothetical protein